MDMIIRQKLGTHMNTGENVNLIWKGKGTSTTTYVSFETCSFTSSRSSTATHSCLAFAFFSNTETPLFVVPILIKAVEHLHSRSSSMQGKSRVKSGYVGLNLNIRSCKARLIVVSCMSFGLAPLSFSAVFGSVGRLRRGKKLLGN
jgi:hypothetical protein